MKTYRKLETNQHVIQAGIAVVSIKPACLHFDRRHKPSPTLFVNASYIGINRKDAAKLLRENRRFN